MQYAWLIWSLLLLAIWLAVYFSLKSRESRREMLIVSFWTSLFGFTEPIFVPEYWSPPSLFDLALKTGFDIESFLFSFGVGGLAVILYERIFQSRHKMISVSKRQHHRHRYHLWTLLSGPVAFLLIWIFSDLNPIYSVFISLMIGGLFAWYCRPDLKKKMLTGALLFLGLYFIYFLTLIIMFPGYVEKVWNLSAISGVLILGIPLEELMFAFGLGFFWSSVFEHLTWRTLKTKIV